MTHTAVDLRAQGYTPRQAFDVVGLKPPCKWWITWEDLEREIAATVDREARPRGEVWRTLPKREPAEEIET